MPAEVMIMSTLTLWASHMRFTGAAENTVSTRLRALRRLEREYGDPLTLTRDDLTAFLSAYTHASTRSTNLSYLRVFYQWAVDEGHVAENPTRKLGSVKVPTGVPRPAPLSDVVALLETAPKRTRMFALLMAYCGLRCCEVALVRHEHITQSGDGSWWLAIPHSKGGHSQSVPIPSWVAAEVLASDEWAVTVQTVQRDTRKAFLHVGSTATPHQLRHFYGTTALQKTQNLRYVQQMMRHASPATTARYTLVTSQEISDVAESLPRIA